MSGCSAGQPSSAATPTAPGGRARQETWSLDVVGAASRDHFSARRVRGRCGGYVLDKTLTLPPLNFTAAEMVAIAVSMARAEATPFASVTRSALRKVLASAPAARQAEGRNTEGVRLGGKFLPVVNAS